MEVLLKSSAQCRLYNWSAKIWQRLGSQRVYIGFSQCPRRTGIRPQPAVHTRRAHPSCQAPPLRPRPLREGCLGVDAGLLLRKELHHSCKAPVPSILRSYVGICPIRSHYLHFAVYHDRPILVLSLDRRRCQKELSEEGVTIAARAGSHDLGYRSIRPPKGLGRLAHPRSSRRPASQLSSTQLAPPTSRSSTDPDQGSSGASYDQEAADASSTCSVWGTAMQKPGRIVVRHFRHWPLCCSEGRPCPRHLGLPEHAAVRAAKVRQRGILRARLDAAELVTLDQCEAGLRGGRYHSCSAASKLYKARGFWLRQPRCSLARPPQLQRGRSGEREPGRGWHPRQKGRMRMKGEHRASRGLLSCGRRKKE